ncbi:MAG: prolipoprotein diacylglyceryl transferase [Peptostreptococcaceae bacterium]|nr:prolipoprotein diacylglyceryl transferase [Peptostreptococcaceae bacterium]
MDPTAFTVFGISITWYGIILTFAMVLAVTLSMKSGKKQGFVADDFLDIGIVALPTAIICARAYYVLFNLSSYDTIWDMINIRQGGLAIHGGLIGGVLAGVIVAKIKKMNIIRAMDVVVPFIALAQSIGRWGNYVNQEAYGVATDLPWAITINGQKVHPTFLYESIWDLLIFALLARKSGNKDYDGQLAAYYMILYSLGRFFIEGLRTDSLMLGNLRAAQIASIVMIVLGILAILIFKDRGIGPSYVTFPKGKNSYSFAKALRKEENDRKKNGS